MAEAPTIGHKKAGIQKAEKVSKQPTTLIKRRTRRERRTMSADNIGTPVESSKGSEHSLPSDIPHLNEKSREELADAAAMDGLATETANRSVVIRGLPRDVRERELRNLVVLLPGYEVSEKQRYCSCRRVWVWRSSPLYLPWSQ